MSKDFGEEFGEEFEKHNRRDDEEREQSTYGRRESRTSNTPTSGWYGRVTDTVVARSDQTSQGTRTAAAAPLKFRPEYFDKKAGEYPADRPPLRRETAERQIAGGHDRGWNTTHDNKLAQTRQRKEAVASKDYGSEQKSYSSTQTSSSEEEKHRLAERAREREAKAKARAKDRKGKGRAE